MNPTQDYSRWVARARAGDSSAWQFFYTLVADQVVSRLSMPPHVDADEVTSETVTAVWRGLDRLREADKVTRFARTVARRVLLRKAKENSRFVPLTTEPATPSRDLPASNLEGEELLGALSSALSSADQKLFRLLYVLGASSPEVQTSLGLSPPLLRKKKHRLNQKLRKAVDRLPR